MSIWLVLRHPIHTLNSFGPIRASKQMLYETIHTTNTNLIRAEVYDGEVLPLTKVSRNEMGAYLCIGMDIMMIKFNISDSFH